MTEFDITPLLDYHITLENYKLYEETYYTDTNDIVCRVSSRQHYVYNNIKVIFITFYIHSNIIYNNKFTMSDCDDIRYVVPPLDGLKFVIKNVYVTFFMKLQIFDKDSGKSMQISYRKCEFSNSIKQNILDRKETVIEND